jgi:hypothetical protein
MVMRWLTRDWAGGGGGALDRAQSEQVITAFNAHREEVLPMLPEPLRMMMGARDAAGDTYDLHDARIESRAAYLPEKLQLQLLCVDDRGGFRAIDVVYAGRVALTGTNEGELAAWLGNPQTELLYQEADVLGDGRLEHRHLLWPEGEFGVRFTTISVRVTPASSARYHDLRRMPL